MLPTPDMTFIATIADRDGWVFEHVLDAPSQAAAEREVQEIVRYGGMTLIGVRPAPVHDAAFGPRRMPAAHFIAVAVAATVVVGFVARVVAL